MGHLHHYLDLRTNTRGSGALLLASILLIPIMLLLFLFGYRRKYFGEQLKAVISPSPLEDLFTSS
jgi:hypothetical protein